MHGLLKSATSSGIDELDEQVRMEILVHSRLLQQFGPQLGRPRVGTLKDSGHTNMKELTFVAADGVWRVAFAFDPMRKAMWHAREPASGDRRPCRFRFVP